jgi:DNA-binding NtrC family response regulator
MPSYASPDSVLLVDDEMAIRELAGMLLRKHGYRTLLARNAAEALQISRTEASVRVLLTDVQMGQESIDGFELAELIKAERPGVSIVVMSGSVESRMLAETRGLPFLQKPFVSDTLMHLIRDALSSAPAYSNRELGVAHSK